jgi:hypothetical protein
MLVGKLLAKQSLGGTRQRQNNDIMMDLMEMGCGYEKRMKLTQGQCPIFLALKLMFH